MSAFTRHLTAKFRIIGLDPIYWALFIPLCICMFISFWVELSMDLSLSEWHGPIRWLLMAALTAVFLGGRTSTGNQVQLNKLTMPNLPVGPAARVAAEVAYILILFIIARIIHLFFVDEIAPLPVINETLTGLLVIIPIFVVFVPRDRGDRPYYILDASVIILTLCLLVELGAFRSLGFALISCIALVIIAVFLNRLEGLLYQSFRPQTHFSGAMCRPARNPEQQFRRDLWLRPWYHFRWHLVLLAIAQIAGIIVYHRLQLPVYYISLWTGIMLYFWLGLMIAPAGLGSLVSESGHKSTFYSDFDGAFLAAWSVLPLHPVRIIRGAYLYILVAGTFFWTVTLLTFILAEWPYSFHFWVPFLIAIPCLAGFITMAAVGNKPLAIFLAVLFCAELIIGTGLMDQSEGPGIIGITVLVVFIIVSVVPVVPVLRGKIQIQR